MTPDFVREWRWPLPTRAVIRLATLVLLGAPAADCLAQENATFELRLDQARSRLSQSADEALSRARELRDEAIQAGQAGRSVDAARVEISALHDLGRSDQAFELAEAALADAQDLHDPTRQSHLLRQMAGIHIDRNQYPEAEARLGEALALAERSDDPAVRARALSAMARVRRYQVRYLEALEYANQAIEIFRQVEDLTGVADIIGFRGVVLEKIGQFEPALAAHTEALAVWRQLDDLSGVATALFNIGEIHRELEDHDLALDYFRQTLELDRQIGDKLDIAYSLNLLGRTHMDLGNMAEARAHLEQAVALFEEVDARRDVAWAQTLLGKAEVRLGNLQRARELLGTALDTGIARDALSLVPFTRSVLVELELASGNSEAAVRHAREGLKLAREIDERDQAADLLGDLAQALRATGDLAGAVDALSQQQAAREALFRKTRAEAFALMQTQAELLRRAQRIELLEREQALDRERLARARTERFIWIGALIGGFAILLLLLIYLQQRQLSRKLGSRVAERTRELEGLNSRLEAAYRAVEEASQTDQLTNLNNRRFLESHIAADLARTAGAYDTAEDVGAVADADLIFLLVDFDHFKSVNDEYGHAGGDAVLRQVRGVLQGVFREDDHLVRWGGEEFLAVARHASRAQAPALAERVRQAVAGYDFALDDGDVIRCTCSIGFACYPFDLTAPAALDWNQAVDIADIALYAAKASGRDAWVGLSATGRSAPGTMLRAMRESPSKACERGWVAVTSSLGPARPLLWN